MQTVNYTKRFYFEPIFCLSFFLYLILLTIEIHVLHFYQIVNRLLVFFFSEKEDEKKQIYLNVFGATNADKKSP